MERDQGWAVSLFAGAIALSAAAPLVPVYVTEPFLVGAALLFVLAVWFQVRDLRSRPRLVIGEPARELRGVIHKRDSRDQRMISTTTTATTTFISSVRTAEELTISGWYPTTHMEPGEENVWGTYVRMRNQPKILGRDAENVITELRFVASDETVTEMHGRWSQVPQHGDPERTLEAEGIAIPSNGEPKWVDVAIKYHGDDACYAFNDENRFRSKDLRYRPLGPSPIRVDVTAKGSNCRRASASFVLTHKGKGSSLCIEALGVGQPTRIDLGTSAR